MTNLVDLALEPELRDDILQQAFEEIDQMMIEGRGRSHFDPSIKYLATRLYRDGMPKEGIEIHTTASRSSLLNWFKEKEISPNAEYACRDYTVSNNEEFKDLLHEGVFSPIFRRIAREYRPDPSLNLLRVIERNMDQADHELLVNLAAEGFYSGIKKGLNEAKNCARLNMRKAL